MTACGDDFKAMLEQLAKALNVEVEACLAIGLPTMAMALGYSEVKFSNTYSANVVVWSLLCMSVASGKSQVVKFFQVPTSPLPLEPMFLSSNI